MVGCGRWSVAVAVGIGIDGEKFGGKVDESENLAGESINSAGKIWRERRP